MGKVKIMSIFGTRPEAIKMAPVIKAIESNSKLESVVCVTAQHRELLDRVLDMFGIKPDYDLDIMKSKQTLTDITTRALKGLEQVLLNEKPDMILVHGDTTTTFAGALAAFYNHIPVGHVEAGLRTYDKLQPFPEEINRMLTGSLATLHFAPTSLAKDHLIRENINENCISVTGNTAIDVLTTTLEKDYQFENTALNQLDFTKKLIVMTAHRRENHGEPLENICNAVNEIVNRYDDVEVVYAVHPNPVVKNTAKKILGNNKKVHLLEPLDMKDMHNLMNKSYMVMTDSGGLQEEVPSMGKPVLVLRNVTERPEGVDAGTLKLVGTDTNHIINTACELIDNKTGYEAMAKATNPFGDGHASERIIDAISKYFNL